MKYIYVLLVVNLVIIGSISAQNRNTDANITGHVIDAKTKEHLPYVTVYIKGTTISVTTDASGHFFLKSLPLGRETIAASMTGYSVVEKSVLIEAHKTLEVNFELSESVVSLNEVVVSASRYETKRKESPSIVNVLNRAAIENSASTNLGQALNFQPGLRVETSCQNCGFSQVRINGLDGQYSQILIDSRPIFSSLASVYGLEQLPESMIDRIEVIRGGGSALYGSSAIGGIVNIITKEPVRNSASLSRVSMFMGGGAQDANTALNGSFITDNNRAGIYLFGMIRSRDPYDRDKDGFSEIPKLKSETIGFRGFYKTGDYSKLTIEYHHMHEYRRGGDRFDFEPHEANIAEQLRHNIDGGGVKFDLFSKDFKHRLNLFVSGQRVDRGSYFGAKKNLNAYGKTDDRTFVAGAQYVYGIDNLLFLPADFTVGVEYNYNYLSDKMLGYNKELEQSSKTYGLYFQNEWKSERVNLLLGGRLDKNNFIDGVIFSPRANVRYSPIDELAFRLSYSSGYRAPQTYSEDLHIEAINGKAALISVSPDLRPEYSNSISASIDWFKNIGSVRTNLLVEGFYTNLKDLFDLVKIGEDASGNILKERRNASGANVKGVNAEFRLLYSSLINFQMGYTYQRSRYKEEHRWSEDNPNIAPNRKMLRTPDSYGYAMLSVTPNDKFNLSLTANYTGSMTVQHFAGYIPQDREEITPSFFDMGIKLSYDFKLSDMVKVQINGGVKNIFDSFQRDLDQTVERDAGYIYGPSLPRSIFVGIKFNY